MTVRQVDGRGGTIFAYEVIDAVSDRRLARIEDDSFDWDDLSAPETPQASWRRVGSEVTQMLRDHGIVQTGELPVRGLPFESGGYRFDASTLVDLEVEPDDPAFDRIEAYEVWMRRVGESAKRVSVQTGIRAVGVAVAGYIQSPFESRVLLAVLEERYVFEGSELLLRLYGSHLNVGFERQGFDSVPDPSGVWHHEADVAELFIDVSPDGTLSLRGQALSTGNQAGAVNVAEIDAIATYSERRAYAGIAANCELELFFADEGLNIRERGSCGGRNAAFGGAYHR
jgi:hypothetical protein